jgi:glycyl-tRNA synthetase
LANAWDLGPYGAMLRKNILDSWWKTFVQKRQDIIPLDSAILMNPKVWEASGHLGNFSDPLIDDKNTGERFRVDKLIEEKIEEFRNEKTDDEIQTQLKNDFGVENLIPESWTFEQMEKFIEKYISNNPNTGKKADWTNVRKFNLMFKTFQGVIEDASSTIYLRPETAQ